MLFQCKLGTNRFGNTNIDSRVSIVNQEIQLPILFFLDLFKQGFNVIIFTVVTLDWYTLTTSGLNLKYITFVLFYTEIFNNFELLKCCLCTKGKILNIYNLYHEQWQVVQSKSFTSFAVSSKPPIFPWDALNVLPFWKK